MQTRVQTAIEMQEVSRGRSHGMQPRGEEQRALAEVLLPGRWVCNPAPRRAPPVTVLVQELGPPPVAPPPTLATHNPFAADC